jgi:peptidyl-prolyl cis-trans isomerase B (cyclophilin B)
MAVRAIPWRAGAGLAVAGLLLLAGLPGCKRRAVKVAPAKEPAPAVAGAGGKGAPKGPPDRLNQPFADAIRKDPPADWPRLADVTATGKSVGKLYTEVERLWKDIPFATPEGKGLAYSATVETDQGVIEIALRPDVAPNHVRNFVALARAGYYDGLVFGRLVHQESDDKKVQLDLIEGGQPLGSADAGYDSIGYWLKPEFDDEKEPRLPHEDGAVGACHGAEDDTAACKFYIIAGQAPPSLNGRYTVFGKVSQGLDVVHKIYARPVIHDEEDGGYHRPEKPVVIRKVAINTREVDNPGANGDNK